MSTEKDIKEILEEINKYQKDIDRFLNNIAQTKNDKIKINLYKNILSLDNTKEKYVLDYLLCIKRMVGNKEYKNVDYENEVTKYEICLSEENYQTNFKEISRTNARKKILEFFDFIKNCSFNTDEEKIILISRLSYFLHKLNNSFNNTKMVTWQNEELYLNYLYKFLINSICNLIAYFNTEYMSGNLLEDEEYKKINEKFGIEIKNNKETKNSTFSSINYLKNKLFIYFLSKEKFFDYIKIMKSFLKKVDKSFNEKFKDLAFKDMKDKLLFEDYINFLSTYKFENYEYVPFWMESFVPLNLDKKKEIINEYNKNNCEFEDNDINFELSQDGAKLKISDDTNCFSIDIDKYVLTKLKNEARYDSLEILKRKINQYIKPNYYQEELFVCKTKDHWKKLLIKIFQSKVYKQARDSIFTQPQIDFFKIDNIISEIIDNLKFFVYNTSFLGNTNKDRTNIYEYGNYNVNIENKSISLLIFYGFHVIINLHEIGAHLYIKYQNYFSLNENSCSPKLNSENLDLYSPSAIKRRKESVEQLEIELFGNIKNELTIKEALFILNKDNYELSKIEFKEKFLNCNSKSLKDLIDTNLKQFLSNLGINSLELKENDKTVYKYPFDRGANFHKYSNINTNRARHPLCFYYDDTNFIKDFFFQNFVIGNDESN